MRSESHGLGSVPAGESVCGETRMNESEMRAIQNMVQVVIVVVHLRRRKLTLVDDVLGRKRAYVEALRKRTSDETIRHLKLTLIYLEEWKGTNMVCVACLRRI